MSVQGDSRKSLARVLANPELEGSREYRAEAASSILQMRAVANPEHKVQLGDLI